MGGFHFTKLHGICNDLLYVVTSRWLCAHSIMVRFGLLLYVVIL